MSEVATVVVGWGITFVALATYSTWVVLRGKGIGQELGIGEIEQSDVEKDTGATTDS
tara:strand:- start:410 stop:580 length:171 start_codon:yes stop_codon:yes gene_type:complete